MGWLSVPVALESVQCHEDTLRTRRPAWVSSSCGARTPECSGTPTDGFSVSSAKVPALGVGVAAGVSGHRRLKSWTGPWRPLCPLQPLSQRRETQGDTATHEQSHRKRQQRRDQNLGLPSPHSQNPARGTKEVRAAEFEKGQEGETKRQPAASSPRCNINE